MAAKKTAVAAGRNAQPGKKVKKALKAAGADKSAVHDLKDHAMKAGDLRAGKGAGAKGRLVSRPKRSASEISRDTDPNLLIDDAGTQARSNPIRNKHTAQ